MDPATLAALLGRVKDGTRSMAEAMEELRALPFADLGYARVDHHRALRQGVPEIIYGAGKTPEQIAGIIEALGRAGQNAMVTRLDADAASYVQQRFQAFDYDSVARVGTLLVQPVTERGGEPVAVVTAGTSDLPVAEEANRTLALCGIPFMRVYDVGVAGLHRLLSQVDVLRRARAVIVIAGMEGALPSVVGGLVSAPVVAVPTSVGYGASFGGFTALFGMLSGCAAGVTVVNIDNGFGAALAVHRMLFAAAEAPGIAEGA